MYSESASRVEALNDTLVALEDTADALADVFKLMGDATRLRIIMACLKGPICVNELAARVGCSASLASHHLRLLRAARLLRAERRGKQVFYSVMDGHIACVIHDMVEHVGEPAGHEEGV